MNTQTAIEQLNREWEPQNGFLGKVRYRTFDPDGLDRLIQTLEAIDIEEGKSLDRRLVSLLWFMPIFLEWQKPSFEEAGIDIKTLDSAINRIMPLLYKILGIP